MPRGSVSLNIVRVLGGGETGSWKVGGGEEVVKSLEQESVRWKQGKGESSRGSEVGKAARRGGGGDRGERVGSIGDPSHLQF